MTKAKRRAGQLKSGNREIKNLSGGTHLSSTSKTAVLSNSTLAQPVSWHPHKFQKKGIQFLLSHPAAGLFAAPGVGKTSIVFACVKLLKKNNKRFRGLLVVAPLRPCYLVWPAEQQKWKDFAGLRVEVLHGAKKQQALQRKADIYVINPEGLTWLFQPANFNLLAKRVCSLCIDELTRFKNMRSDRFKTLKPRLSFFARRWGLTGTPAPNGLMDLFGQMYALDQGASLGRFITHYRQLYFEPAGFMGYEWRLKLGADKEIFKRIRNTVLRIGDEHLDLPKRVDVEHIVELPAKVRKMYDEMEEELITAFESGEITAANAAVASMKCSQIANGGIFICDIDAMVRTGKLNARQMHQLHYEKADAVKELVEELQGAPLLVAYEFQHDRERLLEVLGKKTPYIGGGVTPKQSTEIQRQWNLGLLPVLLGQPQSVAHGLNMQAAGYHVAWHSITWDFELYDQFIRRILRQGNKAARVYVHHFIAKDTVDVAKMRALRGKERTQNVVFQALRGYAKARAAA